MNWWCYDLTKLICWLFFRLGFGLEVSGQEHVPTQGPFILASNHYSFLDPPLVGDACPRRVYFMARDSLFVRPILGAFLRAVRVTPLRRGEADAAAIRMSLQQLRHGEVIAIFPEGTRQLSGKLGTAKRGVGFLAEAADVPVVPALVQGTFEALPPHAKRLYRAKIRVAFGRPISYTKTSFSSSNSPGVEAANRGADLRERAEERGESTHAKRGRKPAPRRQQQALADAITEEWRRLENRLSLSPHPSHRQPNALV